MKRRAWSPLSDWLIDNAEIVAVVVGILLLMLFLNRVDRSIRESPPQPTVQQKAATEERNLAFYAGRKIVDGVRNPASVRFSFAAAMADGSLCYDLRSQNGLGGMSEGMVVETKKHGYQYQQDAGGSHGFRAAWNAHCANKQPAVSVLDDLNEYAKGQQ